MSVKKNSRACKTNTNVDLRLSYDAGRARLRRNSEANPDAALRRTSNAHTTASARADESPEGTGHCRRLESRRSYAILAAETADAKNYQVEDNALRIRQKRHEENYALAIKPGAHFTEEDYFSVGSMANVPRHCKALKVDFETTSIAFCGKKCYFPPASFHSLRLNLFCL